MLTGDGRRTSEIAALRARFARCGANGVPNVYGEQRFGADAATTRRAGLALLRGERRERDKRKRQAHAVGAAVGGLQPRARAAGDRGRARRVRAGDVLKKTDSGGLFVSTEPEVDQRARRRGRAHPDRRRCPAAARSSRRPTRRARARGRGDRRRRRHARGFRARRPRPAGRAPPGAAHGSPTPRFPRSPRDEPADVRAVRFRFTLPAGGYATVVVELPSRVRRRIICASVFAPEAMHLTERILGFTLLGSEWVLWLLIGLSVLSVAVMVERAIFLRAARRRRRARARAARRCSEAATSKARARRSRADRARPRRSPPPGSTTSTAAPRRSVEAMAGAKARLRDRHGTQPRRAGHAGQQRAVHRPVRHRARHHQGVRRSVAQPGRRRGARSCPASPRRWWRRPSA